MTGRGDAGGGEQGARRQVVKFSFFRVDPRWRALTAEARDEGKRALIGAVNALSDRLQVRAYSVVGMRGDTDFLLWQIGESLDDLQALHAGLLRTPMAPHLTMPHSYLAMTRRSVYVSSSEAADRLHLHPAESRYFFVYPFVKTRAWYQLPLDERQVLMDEHIRIGRKYPSVKLNTTYSFGLDDQEFVVSFETDEPADFLDLVMELREAKSSMYTLRDTPIFTCVSMSLADVLDTLGGVGEGAIAHAGKLAGVGNEREVLWGRVAEMSELPAGSSLLVYFDGTQVALFNVDGAIHAIANRCSHANGSLVDGVVAEGEVTCPMHESRFDLKTGLPRCGPASRPVPTYEVRLEDGHILLAPRGVVAGA